MRYQLKAYGKVNLGLKVYGRRDDGYHEIETIMQHIELCDRIIVEKSKDFSYAMTPELPESCGLEENTMYRAWQIVKEAYPHIDGLQVHVEKNIPIAAGLAGGSADGAAIFHALNEIYELGLNRQELQDLAKPLGADVPFMLDGPCALAGGIGQDLKQLIGHRWYIVLINPGYPVSTAEIYRHIDEIDIDDWSFEMLLHTYKRDDRTDFLEDMDNDLGYALTSIKPDIAKIKTALINVGAMKTLVSGSGPTVMGFFRSMEEAQRAEKVLQADYPFVKAVKTRTEGPGIEMERLKQNEK